MARVFGLKPAYGRCRCAALRLRGVRQGDQVLPRGGEEGAEGQIWREALDFAAVMRLLGTLSRRAQRSVQERILRATCATEPGLATRSEPFLCREGLPHRPWFRHAIYAPGEYTGYAAVVIPGVNEALDKGDMNELNSSWRRLRPRSNAPRRPWTDTESARTPLGNLCSIRLVSAGRRRLCLRGVPWSKGVLRFH